MLVTGATGTLGQAFARIAEHRGLPACLTTRDQLDLADDTSIERALDEIAPWAVVNAAGFVRVADAEQERDACMAANADGPERLARACARRGIRLVTFSSDLVFDGTLGRPCHEGDPVSPGCIYGHSKAEMERRVLHEAPDALVLRTSAFFGPWDRWNFAWSVLAQLAAGGTFRASRSVLVSPTFVPDLVHASLDLLIDGEAGIWHLANQGRLSWHEFASRVARGAGYDPALILPFEEREAETSLASRRGILLRPLDAAISDFLAATRSLHADQAAMAVAAE